MKKEISFKKAFIHICFILTNCILNASGSTSSYKNVILIVADDLGKKSFISLN